MIVLCTFIIDCCPHSLTCRSLIISTCISSSAAGWLWPAAHKLRMGFLAQFLRFVIWVEMGLYL